MVDVLDPAHVRDGLFDERLHQAYAQVVKAQPEALKAQMARRYAVASNVTTQALLRGVPMSRGLTG